jgi:hypothetical protein
MSELGPTIFTVYNPIENNEDPIYRQVNEMMSSSWIHIHMSFIAHDVIKCGRQIHGENSVRFLRMKKCRFITLVVHRMFGGWRETIEIKV